MLTEKEFKRLIKKHSGVVRSRAAATKKMTADEITAANLELSLSIWKNREGWPEAAPADK